MRPAARPVWESRGLWHSKGIPGAQPADGGARANNKFAGLVLEVAPYIKVHYGA
jgi:hypothetical protein